MNSTSTDVESSAEVVFPAAVQALGAERHTRVRVFGDSVLHIPHRRLEAHSPPLRLRSLASATLALRSAVDCTAGVR